MDSPLVPPVFAYCSSGTDRTVFTVSHDVKIEGKPLPAGRYGLHMLAGQSEWTIIFSKNSTSWGS